MNAPHSPQVLALQGDPETIRHFLAPCPVCSKVQKFTPELLFRSLMTTDIGNYASEQPKFLLRKEEQFGKDPEEEKEVHAFFASVCTSPECQVPIFLRVKANKVEFMKIMRARAGRPYCQTEADLRPSELTLIATYPKSPEHDTTPPWCDQELGQLCETLNEFEPSRLKNLSNASFRSSAQNVIEQMLLKLESKKYFIDEIELMYKRKSAWFAFCDKIKNLFSDIKPDKLIREAATEYSKHFKTPAEASDFVLIDCFLLGSPNTKHDANDLKIQKLNSFRDRAIEQAQIRLTEQIQSKRTAVRSFPQRLKTLFDAGYVPRDIWRWACRIATDAGGTSNAAFCSKLPKAELAIFVRSFAARAFQHPYETVQQMRMKAEDKAVAIIPTKTPKPVSPA
jgi:hypothetical protein